MSFAISNWIDNLKCWKFYIDNLASWQINFSRTTIDINTSAKSIYYKLSRLSTSNNISNYTFEFIICAIDFIDAKEQSIYYALSWCSNDNNISIYILRFPICVANFNVIKNKKSSYQLRWSFTIASSISSYTFEHITTIAYFLSIVQYFRKYFL